MVTYLAMQILKGKISYTQTIEKFPQYKEDIDLISSSSLPVGILSDIKLDRKTTKVKYGDYIIMVSDGILDAGKNNNLGDNWLIYFLKNIKTTNPKEIADLILDRALEIQEGVVEDDMTVLVTKICSN